MGSPRRTPHPDGARQAIGVLSPVVGGFYFGGLIAGITQAAQHAGYGVVAVQTHPAGLDRERHPDEPLPEVPGALDTVDGYIIIAHAVHHDRLASIRDWGRPFVLVSENDANLTAPMVLPDNAGGARAAVEHLIEHGHSRIGFVGNLAQLDIRERYEAYRAALEDHGIHAEPEWLFEATDSAEQGGAEAAAHYLAAGSPTAATVAGTDRNAIGFIRALRAGGLVLPRDHAVIGFDHTESGARLVPRLSTVDPHHDRVGELAVSLLLAQLRGEQVDPGIHRVPGTFVTRESCGCGEVSAVGQPCREDSTVQPIGSTPARARLCRLVRTAFAGPVTSLRRRWSEDEARTGWLRAVLDPLDAAADRGAVPPHAALNRVGDLTAALKPHPEALEQCVAALRAVEAELLAGVESAPERRAVLQEVATDVLVALTRGCTRSILVRNGRLERTIADQYEVDIDLLCGKGPSPQTLTWLPRRGRGPACLGLWVDKDQSPGEREIEIVGVAGEAGALSRLIGLRLPANQFPPPALTRSTALGGSNLTFVIPVTSPASDWGLLAIGGHVEPRMTSAREKYNHWSALLAVALDQERLVQNLEEQRHALEQAASREHALAAAVRSSEERYAMASQAVQHGMWDWDVTTGSVFYSAQWKKSLGYDDGEIGSSPTEWLDRVHPEDRDELAALIAAQLAGSQTPMVLEHRVRTASGEYRWMMCRAITALDDAQCPARMVGVLVDITERKGLELALSQKALRDPETGFANRMLFLDRLGTAIERAQRSGVFDCSLVLLRVAPERLPAAGAAIDEDAQTEVRRELARRIDHALVGGDTAARLSRDEFAVIVDDIGPGGDAMRVAELLAHVRTDLGAALLVGVLPSIQRFHDPDEALRAAGIALLRDQTDVELIRSASPPPSRRHATSHGVTRGRVSDPL